MNVKKIISLIMLLFMLLPLGAQNSEGKQRYKIAACDWMMLKRQKIGSFQLMKELGGDGIEMDMGGLGKRDTFDNKFHQPHFCKLFKETAQEQHIEVPSVAMSGFFGEGGNLAASKIRNLECPSYEICLIDYGCGKFNRKIHIMEQYP